MSDTNNLKSSFRKKNPGGHKKISFEIKKNYQLYSLLLLPLVWIILFHYIPIYGIQIAFKKYRVVDGILGSEWVGLKHFIRFFKTYYFARILKNTFVIGIYSLIAGFPFPIILALALNTTQYPRFKKTAQMITYAPYFISVVVLVGMLNQFMSPKFGIINKVIMALGGEPVMFLTNAKLFSSVYVWSGVWQSAGWGSIIYLAALSGIDPQLHEAAIIDGASVPRRIIHIDIPGIMPTIIILLVLSAGRVLGVGFEKVYLMQNDLNLKTSEVISTYIYKEGLFNSNPNYSYGAAVGLLNSVVNFVLLVAVNAISRKCTDTSLW